MTFFIFLLTPENKNEEKQESWRTMQSIVLMTRILQFFA